MKNKEELTYRMYGWVNYQLSGIQAGIQFGHAVVEYANEFFETGEYKKWSKKDKTFIVLNGGATNDTYTEYGLQSIVKKLEEFGVKFATFREPDLNNALTGICLLVDERVFDSTNYPIELNVVDEQIFPKEYTPNERDLIKTWGTLEKGLKMYELRNYLRNFRLA